MDDRERMNLMIAKVALLDELVAMLYEDKFSTRKAPIADVQAYSEHMAEKAANVSASTPEERDALVIMGGVRDAFWDRVITRLRIRGVTE